MRSLPNLFAMACLAAGCTAQQATAPPQLDMPASYSVTAPAMTDEEAARWWSRFGDPVLDGLIARALQGNLDVQRAAARIRQARAEYRIVRANGLPEINAGAKVRHNRISENAIPDLPGTGSGEPGSDNPLLAIPGSDFATFQIGFDASWELDLFGKNRSEREAASARIDAAVWSERDAQVLLAASVGDAYFHYRSLQQQVALAQASVAARRELLSLAEARQRNGIDTTSPLRRQEQELAAASASLASLEADRAARLHELAFLLGLAPRALAEELAPGAVLPGTDLAIPAGLPSDLLLRRPDIRAGERRLAASAADVAAARADLFPSIGLTGALQLVSTALSSLISADSIQTSAAANLSAPLFDGGRRRATIARREGEQDEARIDYRSAVLGALRDVEDALSRLDAERTRTRERGAAEAAARDDAENAAVRYRRGLTDKDAMIAAELTRLAAEEARIETQANAATALVALYKALGGGWDPEGNKLDG